MPGQVKTAAVYVIDKESGACVVACNKKALGLRAA